MRGVGRVQMIRVVQTHCGGTDDALTSSRTSKLARTTAATMIAVPHQHHVWSFLLRTEVALKRCVTGPVQTADVEAIDNVGR